MLTSRLSLSRLTWLSARQLSFCVRGANVKAFSPSAPGFSPVLPPSEWNPHENGYVWGDGKLLYFGADGPLSSLRAENLRDSMEDMEMLRMLDAVASPPEALELTRRVAVDTYTFSRSSEVLYQARDAVARFIEARRKAV